MPIRASTLFLFLLLISSILVPESITQVVVPTGNGGFKAYTMNMGYGMYGMGGLGGFGGYLGNGMPYGMYGGRGYGMYG